MGLSLAEAWRISPRSLRIVSRAHHEARLDELDQRIHAAFAGQYFRRQKVLDGRSLKKMLPKRNRPAPQQTMTAEEAIAVHDAWANGINRRIAKEEAARKKAAEPKAEGAR